MESSRSGLSDGTSARGASANGSAPRARQRALCIAALPEGDDLSELAELLRTAGVGVVGELVQHREQPHPNTYLGPGKVAEAKELPGYRITAKTKEEALEKIKSAVLIFHPCRCEVSADN